MVSPVALLDTDILVDLLRQYPPALTWLANQQNLGVTQIIWLELLEGATDKNSERKAVRLLNTFVQVQVESADFTWAIQTVLKFHLSHNATSFDAVIAAAAERLQLPLYTRNLKHFTPMIGQLAQAPY